MSIWIPILTAIVAGVFALFGAILGSRMERKTKHQTWLMEKRAEHFAEFLRIFHKCDEEAVMYLRQGPESGITRDQKFLDIFYPAIDYAEIIRLFLKEEFREAFEILVREYCDIFSQIESPERRSLLLSKKRIIRDLLEKHLKNTDL